MNGLAVTIQYKIDVYDKIIERVDAVRVETIEMYVEHLHQLYAWHSIIDVELINIIDLQHHISSFTWLKKNKKSKIAKLCNWLFWMVNKPKMIK